jgi:N-acetyl-gamma-glutamyl-phosphate reductase
MAHKVFIDGQYGTTGLQIQQRLEAHPNVDLLTIALDQRRNALLRDECLNEADVVFLCLPDDAAREATGLVTNPNTVIIDASSAHRVSPDWVYGIPELPGQRERLRNSNRIANPGCYPTGMTLLTKPLVDADLIPRDYPLAVHAITGYSGGGKAMIADYKSRSGAELEDIAARPKNLDLMHKHLPEMQRIPGFQFPPVFVPTVGNFEQGMIVQVPLHTRLLGGPATVLHETLAATYGGEPFVHLFPLNDQSQLEEGFLRPTACNGTNRIELFVYAADNGLIMLMARLDNLGKGASGAAVQNMNLRLGLDESTGLL